MRQAVTEVSSGRFVDVECAIAAIGDDAADFGAISGGAVT